MSAAPRETSFARSETPLARLLAERIRERGPITFAEYMRECLYHPEFGYYSRADAQRFADFYTSVDVHPIFGRLIARQLAEMWEQLGRPSPFLAVEAGAGIGRLAGHILDFAARQLPEFYAATQYIAVEQSPARRAAHALTLPKHLAASRATSAASLPDTIPAGCIFSNELLDALPVHRVVRESSELREIYVGRDSTELREVTQPLSTPSLAEYFRVQDIELIDEQQAEAGLGACAWIEDAGKRLQRGFVVTIDYGHEAPELYSELHMRGTALAYQQHRVGEDYFRAPGEQDLTAHVNFTALDQWGRRSLLEPTGLVSQARFLMALGRGNEFADLYEEGQTETDRLRARLKLKTLIFPEGMGERFQVFIQHKGIEAPQLTGLHPI
jgi:SAM-dependent MidA family methyltransferase